MHEDLNRGRRAVIEQRSLTFSCLASLLDLAKSDPSLLPALIQNLSNLKLGICHGADDQVLIICDKERNERFLWAGLNEGILLSSLTEESACKISSVSGTDLFSVIAQVNLRGNPIGLIFQYGQLQEGVLKIDSLTIPAQLFKPKFDIFENPTVLIATPERIVPAPARRDLALFFGSYPEIEKAFYAERILKGLANHLVILQTVAGHEISDNFILTTPPLILEQYGFKANNTWVVCSKSQSSQDLPVQEIYSK